MATLSAVRCNPALRAYDQTLAPPPERPARKKLGPTHADQPSERFRSRVAVRRRDLAHRYQGTGTDVKKCPDVRLPRVPPGGPQQSPLHGPRCCHRSEWRLGIEYEGDREFARTSSVERK